jgi:SpoVK/Ycf46/Vps4 family AAA+-type ATPase
LDRSWSWRRNYRVWEASRKVFLYPENWLEPELRPSSRTQLDLLEVARLAGQRPTSVLLTAATPAEALVAGATLAAALGRDLYRVDLNQVVSKYIGETEKNLDRIFEAAARVHVVLLFDEADALFGKRSDVADSHDRFANAEVGHLLQRIERYEDLAVLATNRRREHLEPLLRRFPFVIDDPAVAPGESRD